MTFNIRQSDDFLIYDNELNEKRDLERANMLKSWRLGDVIGREYWMIELVRTEKAIHS